MLRTIRSRRAKVVCGFVISYRTSTSPSSEVGQRLVALAQGAAQRLQALIAGPAGSPGSGKSASPSKWRSIFRSSLQDFDLLILLRKEALPQASRALALEFPDIQSGRDAFGDFGADEAEPPSKRARVVLRAFPEQLVTSKGANKLKPELLIGGWVAQRKDGNFVIALISHCNFTAYNCYCFADNQLENVVLVHNCWGHHAVCSISRHNCRHNLVCFCT